LPGFFFGKNEGKMSAATLDFNIEQGATFSHRLEWKDSKQQPINLTGYTARMQVRAKKSSDTVLVELTTANGRIVLGDADGTIDLEIDATTTAGFSWTKGVHDLELESGTGFVTRLVEGNVTVVPEVTR
jgi:hypothetical protein